MRVVFTPEAEEQLVDLYRFIAKASSAAIALSYTDAVVGYCESLTTFPNRGIRRDDLRPGLRMTHYRGHTSIAFTVQPDLVEIIGVFHAGRNYERLLPEW